MQYELMPDSQTCISELRNYKVVKSNDLIQKAKFDLSLQEQRIVMFIISQIKPNDIDFKEREFQIAEFCKVCGYDTNSGGNYKHIKDKLKQLRDKSVWIEIEDGSETTLSWIEKVTIKSNGSVLIKLDDTMKPYLLQLKERFTQYELLYTLAMKSQYSIRLYELLKSYQFQKRKLLEIEALKKMLFIENYERFPDFRRKVLDIAVREINEYSDITISYSLEKESRKFKYIEFYIKFKKDILERSEVNARIEHVLDN